MIKSLKNTDLEYVFVDGLKNQLFETIIYLSLKSLVLDINYFSKNFSNKEEAYKKYISYLKQKSGIDNFLCAIIVYMMDSGKIVDCGNHNNLYNKNMSYRQMYDSYMNKYQKGVNKHGTIRTKKCL